MRNRTIQVSMSIVLSLYLGACAALTGGGQEGLKASGVIEATEIRIAPEVSGRVIQVWAEEGDRVEAGDRLFGIGGERLESERVSAEAALRSAQAQLGLAEANLTSAELAVEGAELGLQSARTQLDIRIAEELQHSQGSRQQSWSQPEPSAFELPTWYFSSMEDIESARAEVEAAEAELADEVDDYESLLNDLGPEAKAEERALARARAAFEVAQRLEDRAISGTNADELREALRDRVELAEGELESAQEAYDEALSEGERQQLLEARSEIAVARAREEAAKESYFSLLTGQESQLVRLAELDLGRAEVAVRQAEASVEQARAQLEIARAAVAQAESTLAAIEVEMGKLTIAAPVDATVMTKGLQEGEVVQAGMAGLILADLSDLEITVYLPEDQYGRVAIGDEALVRVDSFPGEEFRAEVIRIADQAEYTPRTVQTEDERQTTVYAVELAVQDPDGKLIPGMPADVSFEPSE